MRKQMDGCRLHVRTDYTRPARQREGPDSGQFFRNGSASIPLDSQGLEVITSYRCRLDKGGRTIARSRASSGAGCWYGRY
jgi:hypothetical protein